MTQNAQAWSFLIPPVNTMPALDTLLPFTGLMILLALSPGPDNLFVLMQSVVHGKTAGLWVTLGLCTGLVGHTLAVAFGLALVLKTSPWLFSAIQTLGAVYLLYLAWQSYRAANCHVSQQLPQLSAGQLYRRGVVMNITNPKVTLFFLAFLPQFVARETEHFASQILVLGGLAILATLLVFGSIALFAGALKILNQSDSAQRRLHLITAGLLALLGLKLFFDLAQSLY
ncbi:MAG: LysE family translocator [Hydrogenovibrio sp.]